MCVSVSGHVFVYVCVLASAVYVSLYTCVCVLVYVRQNACVVYLRVCAFILYF